MTTKQTCPLCGSSLYCVECLGKQEKCEHRFDHNENIKCVKNGYRYFQDELDAYTDQLAKIRHDAKQEVFDDIEKINATYYNGFLKVLKEKFFNEIKKKHGVE